MKKNILIYTPNTNLREFKTELDLIKQKYIEVKDQEDLIQRLTTLEAGGIVIIESFIDGNLSTELCSKFIRKNNFFFLYDGTNKNIIRKMFSLGATDCFSGSISETELFVKVEKVIGERLSDKSFNILNFPRELTLKQAQIYELLKGRGDQGVQRSEFVDLLWNGNKLTTKVVDVHLSNLRKKVKKYGQKIVMNDSKKWILSNDANL